MLLEQLRVLERHLDGVLDLVDLGREAAHVRIRDVRDLLEQEGLDLGLLHDLGRELRAPVDEHVVAHPHTAGAQVGAQPADHLVVVGTADDDAVAVGHDLADRRHVAHSAGCGRVDDDEPLGQADIRPRHQHRVAHVRCDGQTHAAARGQHVDGAPLVSALRRTQHCAVRVGRLRQRGDLRPHTGELVAGAPQGRREVLVPLAGGHELLAHHGVLAPQRRDLCRGLSRHPMPPRPVRTPRGSSPAIRPAGPASAVASRVRCAVRCRAP